MQPIAQCVANNSESAALPNELHPAVGAFAFRSLAHVALRRAVELRRGSHCGRAMTARFSSNSASEKQTAMLQAVGYKPE